MRKTTVMHLKSGFRKSIEMRGAEVFVLTLVENLNISRFNVIAVFLKDKIADEFAFLDQLKQKGITTEVINLRGRYDVTSIFRLRKLIRKHNVNMLHCHGYKGNVIGFFATLFTKTKRITTVHGWTQVDFKVMMYELIDKIVIRYYDKLIAVSEDIKKQLLSYAVPRNKIFVVHNGIDVARFSPRKKGKLKREFKISARYKIIGTIGKLSKEKGHKYFLKAATEIKKKYSNVKFVIVGEGALKRKLKTLAKKVKIENSVIFVGFREDIPEILDDFDIFVLSSVREGIPLVLLEALAKAKPVVSFEVGGIPEVITNGETGILVQARNYKSLAENVVSLLNKPQLAKKIAKKGQERVKKDFNLEAMTDKYQEIYQQIINRKS